MKNKLTCILENFTKYFLYVIALIQTWFSHTELTSENLFIASYFVLCWSQDE